MNYREVRCASAALQQWAATGYAELGKQFLHVEATGCIVQFPQRIGVPSPERGVKNMAFDVKELMVDITKLDRPFCRVLTLDGPCIFPTWIPCQHSLAPFCKLNTYTCFAGSLLTCGGTPFCAGTNDPTIRFQGIDKEALAAIKAQLNAAVKEVEQLEKRLAKASKTEVK